MFESRPLLSISSILLVALLMGTVIQSAVGADEAFPTLRLYLAAHAFCYALLITALDSQRRYQALLSGLTGGVKIDDGRATWEFLVRGAALPNLDKIIVGTRAFQERLKQSPNTASVD